MARRFSATSAPISPSYSKSAPRRSRIVDRLPDTFRALVRRMSEGRIGEHRHPRRDPKPRGDPAASTAMSASSSAVGMRVDRTCPRRR